MTGRQARVRAPELQGSGGWAGTDAPLTLRGLRGRFVLLDFWTAGCINCLHVLAELRPLEAAYADVLVVLGVHSPKFPHESSPAAFRDAVARYGVTHPVLHDPALLTWSQYAVPAWPTLVLVDPEGYVVRSASGEGHVAELGRLLGELVVEHEAKGTLRRGGPVAVKTAQPIDGALRFPASVALLPDGALLVSDPGQHRLVVLEPDLSTVRSAIGSGRPGRTDGARPELAAPQGLCVLPEGSVLVADTGNHLLRRVDVTAGTVTTVAGTGEPRRPGDPVAGSAREVPLSSPWDVCWVDGRVVVAMAGTHQLWTYDPATDAVALLAGTGAEGLRDGPAERAYLAQPSGLAVAPDRVWFVDAETSALRWLRDGQVGTAVGSGLFDFGEQDGRGADALLQHPLGVCLLPDGAVAVLDTYNGALRRYDPAVDQLSTVVTGLREPTGAAVVDGALVVVESAAGRLVRVALPVVRRTDRVRLPPGPVRLSVEVVVPAGQRLDDRTGGPARLTVTGPGLAEGGGTGDELSRDLVLHDGPAGWLAVDVSVTTCEATGPHPACHLFRQEWLVPVTIDPSAPARLQLVLTAQ